MTNHLPSCLSFDWYSQRTGHLRVSVFVLGSTRFPNDCPYAGRVSATVNGVDRLTHHKDTKHDIARLVNGWLDDITERVRSGALTLGGVAGDLTRLCEEQDERAEVDRLDDMRQDAGL